MVASIVSAGSGTGAGARSQVPIKGAVMRQVARGLALRCLPHSVFRPGMVKAPVGTVLTFRLDDIQAGCVLRERAAGHRAAAEGTEAAGIDPLPLLNQGRSTGRHARVAGRGRGANIAIPHERKRIAHDHCLGAISTAPPKRRAAVGKYRAPFKNIEEPPDTAAD